MKSDAGERRLMPVATLASFAVNEVLEGETAMLFLKYLLLLTGWGLLAAAFVNVFRNLYQVVQYHRLLRPTLKGSLSGISSGPEGASTEPLSTRSASVE